MHSVLKTGQGRFSVAAVVASMFLLSAQAGATTLIKKSFDDLVAEADAIVVGTVSETESQYGADKKIHTLVTFSDLKVLHGSYSESSLTMQLPGGQIENDVMILHGSPKFAAKDRVLIFIQNNGKQLVPVVGWIQGVFRLEADAQGRQGVFDHDRTPVLEVRGADVIKDQRNAPDAMIVADPAKASAAGGAGKSDDAAAAAANAAAAARLVAIGRGPMSADAFTRAIALKVREKQAVGKAVQSVEKRAAASEQPGQDSTAPEQ
jgi:hypothetical protein